LYVG